MRLCQLKKKSHTDYWLYSYAFFWVIPRRLNFIFQRFGTLCLFHLHRRGCILLLDTFSSEGKHICALSKHHAVKMVYMDNWRSAPSILEIYAANKWITWRRTSFAPWKETPLGPTAGLAVRIESVTLLRIELLFLGHHIRSTFTDKRIPTMTPKW